MKFIVKIYKNYDRTHICKKYIMGRHDNGSDKHTCKTHNFRGK